MKYFSLFFRPSGRKVVLGFLLLFVLLYFIIPLLKSSGHRYIVLSKLHPFTVFIKVPGWKITPWRKLACHTLLKSWKGALLHEPTPAGIPRQTASHANLLEIFSTHGYCSNYSPSGTTCWFLRQGHMNICVIRLLSQMFMLKIPSSVHCVKDFVTLALWLLCIDYVSLAMYAAWFLW